MSGASDTRSVADARHQLLVPSSTGTAIDIPASPGLMRAQQPLSWAVAPERSGSQEMRRFYSLPSLTALAAFEAVARHRSMTRAAAELNVTVGAISRQVRGLESYVGEPLLRRERRGVDVSAKGSELYGVLSAGFSQISQTLERLRTTQSSTAVTVGASTGIASLWLMKRIGDFWRAHPDITINHLISDNANDLRRAEVDLRIRYGSGSWPDESSAFLFRDYVVPVCGRRFLREHASTSLDALSKV